MANLKGNSRVHQSPTEYQAYLAKKASGDFITATRAADVEAAQNFLDNNYRSSIGEYDNDPSTTKIGE